MERRFGKSYDAYNRLATETDARGNVKTHAYEHARGLHIGTTYTIVDGTAATSPRSFTYNHLGQMTQLVDDSGTRSFAHNNRSELVGATVNSKEYEYAYDNIGNRQQATEGEDVMVYDANALNQYTAITENGAAAFAPQFDADGNQTLIKTETGIWTAV